MSSGCANQLILEFPEPVSAYPEYHPPQPGEKIASESQLTNPKPYSRQMFASDDNQTPTLTETVKRELAQTEPATPPSLSGTSDVPPLPGEQSAGERLTGDKPADDTQNSWKYSTVDPQMDHRDTAVDKAPQKYQRNRVFSEDSEPAVASNKPNRPSVQPEPEITVADIDRSLNETVESGLKTEFNTDWQLLRPESLKPTLVDSVNMPGSGKLWQTRYQSRLRNPMETAVCGHGDSRVLILGSLHGDERLSPEILKALADTLVRHQPHAQITILKTPNPDGLAKGTRHNSRDVDLNQNFPMRLVTQTRPTIAGEFPGSEVETDVLMRLLYDVNPQRVIQLKITQTDDVWVVHNQKAENVARTVSTTQQVRLHHFQPQQLPGSLESYVTTMMDREMITIAIPESWTTDTHQREAIRLLETLGTSELQSSTQPESANDDWGFPRKKKPFQEDRSEEEPIVNRPQPYQR